MCCSEHFPNEDNNTNINNNNPNVASHMSPLEIDASAKDACGNLIENSTPSAPCNNNNNESEASLE